MDECGILHKLVKFSMYECGILHKIEELWQHERRPENYQERTNRLILKERLTFCSGSFQTFTVKISKCYKTSF